VRLTVEDDGPGLSAQERAQATRRFWRAAKHSDGTGTGLGLAVGCSNRTYRGPQRTLTIAAGAPGGVYMAFAELLATEISTEEPRLRATAIPTNGSLDNLRRLQADEVDLALTNTDSAQAVANIGGSPAAPMPMRAIGDVTRSAAPTGGSRRTGCACPRAAIVRSRSPGERKWPRRKH
jgi:hypothetical protein